MNTAGPGKAIPVYCDHSNEEEIKQLFDKISNENDGKLDILVNNAYAAVEVSFYREKRIFYVKILRIWVENRTTNNTFAFRFIVYSQTHYN